MKKFKNTMLLYALITSALMLSVYAAYLLIDVDSLKSLSLGADKMAYKSAIPSKDNSFYVKNYDKNNPQNKFDPDMDDLVKAQAFLLTKVDGRLKQLKPFTDKVDKMSAINDADRKALVKELTGEIDTLAALKADGSKSASKQDVRSAADKIKAEWLKSRASVARAKELMVAAKGNQLVTDADVASASIQKKIDSLKASGKDTKPMEKFYATYSKKVALAKKNVETAQAKAAASGQAATDADKQKLAKEQDEQLKLAENNIKEAYHLVAEEARRDFASRMK